MKKKRLIVLLSFIMSVSITYSIGGKKCRYKPGDMIRSNYIGEMILCYIPPGEFMMGVKEENPSPWFDANCHKVRISHGFFIGKTEVTQNQWEKVMKKNPSKVKGDKFPVTNVTWYECIVFCNKLSKLEGLRPCYYEDKDNKIPIMNAPCTEDKIDKNIYWDFNADGYRLPTEAEWEYSCRAGLKINQCLLSSVEQQIVHSDKGNELFYQYCEDHIHPVALMKANKWGLYDMLGYSVREWCWDRKSYNYTDSQLVIDPRGPDEGTTGRVIRGSSFIFKWATCAKRNELPPFANDDDIGFRIVKQF